MGENRPTNCPVAWKTHRTFLPWEKTWHGEFCWCGRFLFFVVPRKFSLDAGEWPENQILIPEWTNFHCPGATLSGQQKKIKIVLSNQQSNLWGSCQSFFSLSRHHPRQSLEL